MKAAAKFAAALLSVPVGYALGYAIATRRAHNIGRRTP